MKPKNNFLLLVLVLFAFSGYGQKNGYDLWLSYKKIDNETIVDQYKSQLKNVIIYDAGETTAVIDFELKTALKKMMGVTLSKDNSLNTGNSLIIGKVNSLPNNISKNLSLTNLSSDGFAIRTVRINNQNNTVITSPTNSGLLYGTFHFLNLLQQQENIAQLDVLDNPKIDIRVLNHWDNLDRTVERGYAGFSIWNWHTLPTYIDQRYIDYARANASIGINGTVLTNVNSNALILTPHYLEKVKALADVFRPYGIKVYLTARFSAPIEIGGLETADPLDAKVIEWWKTKTAEIYSLIPDFGGFLVKANSEGEPGPQNYGRTHLDGANMMASVLAPHKGIVMWRAFVYSEIDPTDRAKQAYSEFVPDDGQYLENVLIQVKNGAIDFQPREPFHPMFGAMPNTPLMMEFQITKEYLGFATHLVFLPKLFEEVLQSDTFQQGKGSTVAKVINGSLHKNDDKLTGIAGVANIGTDLNWTGHLFGQADWYGFGRLAWNPNLEAEKIADEWLRLTFTKDEEFIKPIKKIMLKSREMVVNYMNPLGLHHIFDKGHHYGPGPWVSNLSRPEWNPVYYHKADEFGVGFDRTKSGSNAVAQYAPELAEKFRNIETCPEEYLLWFHHVAWDYKLKNGRTLWDNLGIHYQKGVNQVSEMIETWEKIKPYIDENQYHETAMRLQIQLKEAIWWKDACMSYFQTFSKMDFPIEMKKPAHDLAYYKSLNFPFAPGIRPSWH